MSDMVKQTQANALESFKALAKQIDGIADDTVRVDALVRLVRGTINTTLIRLEPNSEAWRELLSAFHGTKLIIDALAEVDGRLTSVVTRLNTARFDDTRLVAAADSQVGNVTDTEVLH